MNITETRIEEALTFLAQTDDDFGTLKAEAKRAERRLKSTVALAKKASEEKSQAAKETDAYASEHYQKATDDEFRATENLEQMRARRDREHLVIDVWRTIEASRRRA